MKYILKDYAGVEDGEEPHTIVLKNKNEVIEQLLRWCNTEARLELEVRK